MLEQVIDDIYEAAVVVERWPKVLADLTRLGEAAGASFISVGEGPMRWIGTPSIEALIEDYLQQPHVNSRIPPGLKSPDPWFKTDLDLFTRDEIDTDPFYTEFMRPRGMGWCMATAVRAPGADTILFSVERHYDSGPPDRPMLDTFDLLRPHLARSTLLSVRLGLEKAVAQTRALALLGYPAAVLNAGGRAIAMNNLMQALIPSLVEDRRERLTCTDRRADKLLATALATSKLGSASIQSFPARMPRPSASQAVVHLLPMRGEAQDIFAADTHLLFVTPVAPGVGPDNKLLEALFDLTPAEARVARGIAEAKSLETIAGSWNLSRETVRAQLRAVFAKTGTCRQVELVRLLATVPRLAAT